ncbi:hypothetical protein QWY20_17535 [Alkalimonas sp. MEB108]|uniref:Lipoprotein n=1 Tax=Alkalimonas cellulosilytica TaxID=3058395 RepID=A0ABU7JAG0_9GAMM|nr:hypothetical protein [Alkalimonas sp. MEB108]MEE2003258.1 hypothetical protein [Alkalimonas sp. MEB108]
MSHFTSRVRIAFVSVGIGFLAACGDSKPSFDISTETVGAGSITPAVTQVKQGDSTQLRVSPASNHQIIQVSGCGGRLEGSAFIIPSVQANCRVVAEFAPIMTLSVSSVPTSLSEHEKSTIPFVIHQPYGTPVISLSSSLADEVATVNYSPEKGVITIQVHELFQDNELELTLTVKDQSPAGALVKRHSIALKNTSALLKMQLLDAWREDFSLEAIAQESMWVLDRYFHLGQMAGHLSSSWYRQELQHLASALQDFDTSNLISLTQLDITADYRSKAVDEKALDVHLTQIKEQLLLALWPANQLQQQIQFKLPSSLLPELATDAFYLTEQARLSQFIGNPALGSHDGNGWVFSRQFHFLNTLQSAVDCMD